MLRTCSAQETRLPAAASADALAGRDTTDKRGFLLISENPCLAHLLRVNRQAGVASLSANKQESNQCSI